MKQPPHKSKSKCPPGVTNYCHFFGVTFLLFCHVQVMGQITPLPQARDWGFKSRDDYAAQIAQTSEADLLGFIQESGDWLRREYSPGRISQGAWRDIYDLHRWAQIKQLAAQNPDEKKFISQESWQKLMAHKKLSETFLDEISPFDKPVVATLLLDEILTKHPKEFDQYTALACAFALVWDEPQQWPILHQLSNAQIIRDTSGVSERYLWFVEKNRQNRLKNDLRNLPTDELIFVVDSILALSEAQWVHENVRTERSRLGEVYFSIHYDQGRYKTLGLDWPHGSYALETIQKKGGICVDQAFYAVEVGRAYGIPSLMFIGTGRRGSHAWIGYLKGASGWDMDAGRFTYDKYTSGYTINPKTRQKISDHELEILGNSVRKQAPFKLSERLVQAAQLFRETGQADDEARALNILDAAIQSDSRNLDAWAQKGSILAKFPGDKKSYEDHLKKMSARFASSADVSVAVNQELINLLIAQGRTQEANRMRQTLILKKAGNRHDLSLKLVSNKLLSELRQNKEQEALQEFSKTVEQFKSETGDVLQLLYRFVADSFENGHQDIALQAIEVVEDKLSFDHFTRSEFDRFATQVRLTAKPGE